MSRTRRVISARLIALGAFAAYAAAALEQQRLAAEAEAARPIAEADRMRTALLAAVSHDLRTPLASAKAAVTSLRSEEVQWGQEDRDELLATADESLDRLAHLVDNLLDMSRLQAGALSVFPRPAGLEDIVARALDDLGTPRAAVKVDIPDSLPEVRVDPAILERVIARLSPQCDGLMINANGDPARFAALGLPVIPDRVADVRRHARSREARDEGATRPRAREVQTDSSSALQQTTPTYSPGYSIGAGGIVR